MRFVDRKKRRKRKKKEKQTPNFIYSLIEEKPRCTRRKKSLVSFSGILGSLFSLLCFNACLLYPYFSSSLSSMASFFFLFFFWMTRLVNRDKITSDIQHRFSRISKPGASCLTFFHLIVSGESVG